MGKALKAEALLPGLTGPVGGDARAAVVAVGPERCSAIEREMDATS
jgi:hypothetical protein